MFSVSNANSGGVFPLLDLPMNENGPLERIFEYVGLKDLVALSTVSRLINSLVSDTGRASRGGRLWRGLNDSEWTGYLKQRARCMVIDQSLWRTSPRLSQFLAANGLEAPPERLDLDWRKDVLPGFKAVNSLKIERDAGTTYIVMPKGVTFRMLSDLLAQALGQPTCFTVITQSLPAAYWDTPAEKAYAFVITNSVMENSRRTVLQKRIKLPGKNDCEVIEGIDHLSLLALTYVVTQEQFGEGVRLYSDNPWTYTCVQINDLFFDIGYFCAGGLEVCHVADSGAGLGVGGLRKFRPIRPSQMPVQLSWWKDVFAEI